MPAQEEKETASALQSLTKDEHYEIESIKERMATMTAPSQTPAAASIPSEREKLRKRLIVEKRAMMKKANNLHSLQT